MTVQPTQYFEDIVVGATARFGAYRVTREEMVAFAEKFDPQSFHLSDQAAATTHVGQWLAHLRDDNGDDGGGAEDQPSGGTWLSGNRPTLLVETSLCWRHAILRNGNIGEAPLGQPADNGTLQKPDDCPQSGRCGGYDLHLQCDDRHASLLTISRDCVGRRDRGHHRGHHRGWADCPAARPCSPDGSGEDPVLYPG